MYCVKCGKQLPEGAKFCVHCGAETAFAKQSQAPTTQSPVQNGFPKGAVIAIAAIAVAAIAAIAIVVNVMGAPTKQGGSSQAAIASSSQSASKSATAATPSAEASATSATAAVSSSDSAASSSATASSSQAAPSTTTPAQASAPLIDLADSGDYYDINIFLSNFTEWVEFYTNGRTYDRSNYDLKQLVNWGMWHNAINNDGTLIKESTILPDAPNSEASRGIDGIPPHSYLRHMDTALIHNSIARYMGLDLDLSGFNPGDGSYYEQGGIMYEGLYRGSANPTDNVALVDSVEELGGNSVRVNFTVYMGYREFNAVADKSWYGLDGPSLKAAMEANGSTNITTKPGTAVVDVSGTNGDRTFTLASFEVD